MPVFISHRTIDGDAAKEIYHRLQDHHGIECFIDDYLPDTTPDKFTETITAGLDNCTHLIAVVTENTWESWWVPFEIGYATHCDRAITSYTTLTLESLPEYLWDWPVIGDNGGIDRFAKLYLAEEPLLQDFLLESKGATKKSAFENFSDRGCSFSPDRFHQKLKASLGQS